MKCDPELFGVASDTLSAVIRGVGSEDPRANEPNGRGNATAVDFEIRDRRVAVPLCIHDHAMDDLAEEGWIQSASPDQGGEIFGEFSSRIVFVLKCQQPSLQGFLLLSELK